MLQFTAWKRLYRLLFCFCLMQLVTLHQAACQSFMKFPIGVNLAGTDMPARPGMVGRSYIAPVDEELRYYKSKKIRLFRIPFYWETMQHDLFGPLDVEELRRIDAVLSEASHLKLQVILDVHSYDRRDGKVLGQNPVLENAFANLWSQLARHYRSQKGIFAYGLMNEPHDTGDTWPHTAQLAIDAIRAVDQRHTILLGGDHWSSTSVWEEENPHLLDVKDPSHRLLYEGHVYFDADGSGVYKHTYDEEKAYPSIGVERVKPFINWLKKNHVDGLVDEVGIPGDDLRWSVILDNFLSYLHQQHIGAVYWAGGPLWHHYPLSLEPTKAGDAPQMHVLQRYTNPQ